MSITDIQVWFRRHRRVTKSGLWGFVIGALLMLRIIAVIESYQVVIAPAEQSVGNSAEEILVAPASEPTQLRIPAIKLKTQFTKPLRVGRDNEIEVPAGYEEVGYYAFGPTPGELGPAVVLGHVDSINGPAVFYSLSKVAVGDQIEVDRADGTTAVFIVDRLERHEQAGFPTEQVYGDIDYAGLRLITCSGSFHHGIQRYSHNLIVFARLVDVLETDTL